MCINIYILFVYLYIHIYIYISNISFFICLSPSKYQIHHLHLSTRRSPDRSHRGVSGSRVSKRCRKKAVMQVSTKERPPSGRAMWSDHCVFVDIVLICWIWARGLYGYQVYGYQVYEMIYGYLNLGSLYIL